MRWNGVWLVHKKVAEGAVKIFMDGQIFHFYESRHPQTLSSGQSRLGRGKSRKGAEAAAVFFGLLSFYHMKTFERLVWCHCDVIFTCFSLQLCHVAIWGSIASWFIFLLLYCIPGVALYIAPHMIGQVWFRFPLLGIDHRGLGWSRAQWVSGSVGEIGNIKLSSSFLVSSF